MQFLKASAVAAVLLTPTVVSSQSADVKYCNALAEKYDAYLETAGDKGGRATPVDVVVAMDKCKSDPSSAIPVLEKQLKAAKLSLPPRG
jgi:hypothetical protein